MQKKILVVSRSKQTTKFTRLFYSLYSKRPPFALMQARRRLQKPTIDFLKLLVAARPISSEALSSAPGYSSVVGSDS